MVNFQFPQSALCLLLGLAATAAAGEPVEFNRDIRPILADNCFGCHGRDADARKADLRLDSFAGATEDRGGYAAVAPGKPKESELLRRVTSGDEYERMPPPDSGKAALSAEQVALLKQWIAAGAEYQGHWAFQPIARPKVPKVQNTDWPRGAIDRFVLARLEKEGLRPSPEADRRTLIRRLSLDLTGLPPTLDRVEAFVNDARPDAYARLVDELLTSPHCAERLALDWLDAARYADTNGYSIDDHREMWAWRDWVIHAFMTNKPYDEFLIEQLAGDLLPDATQQQRVATGFLRNGMNTHEGGTIPEEYRVAAIIDKIDTVATTFMGLTMKCAQCHDHKYDPISQREYYEFFAFFNTSSEPGRGTVNGNTPPTIQVESILCDTASMRLALAERIASLRHRRRYPSKQLTAARRAWEKEQLAHLQPPTTNHQPPTFPHPAENTPANYANWIWAAGEAAPARAYFRKTFDLRAKPPRAWLFVSCDNRAEVWINGQRAGDVPDWREPKILRITSLLKPGENLIAIAGENQGGPAGLLALLAYERPDGEIEYIPTEPNWSASAKAAPGWNEKLDAAGDWPAAKYLARHGDAPWGRLFQAGAGAARGLADALRADERQRTDAQWNLVLEQFAKTSQLTRQILASLETEIAILEKTSAAGKTSAMVMDHRQPDRKTYILVRGQYDQHGKQVFAGTPDFLPPLAPHSLSKPSTTNRQPDRLDLARWLVSPAHPLTARVAVNRYWQLLFGAGLVKTSEDFGTQGQLPSHPELLDWLASDFRNHGWNVRRLLRRIVLSSTYRQQSDVTPELLERDPYNRLLARAPRFRLQAELVRDNALAIAGLLSKEIGGPSVYPYQPPDLWKEVSHFGHPMVFTAQSFYQDLAQGLYRRGMYTFWKRTSPPPSLAAFDAPSRETCAARRQTTNTPLQALVLMNDPQYVEAARALGARMMREGGDAPAERVAYGFRLATARAPSAREAGVLLRAYERARQRFAADPSLADKFLQVGDRPRDESLDPVEHAAYAMVGGLILNLSETITRQ